MDMFLPKRILSIFIFCYLLSDSSAIVIAQDTEALGERVQKALNSPPTAEEYPNLNAVMLFKDEHHFVEADGTASIHVHTLSHALTKRGTFIRHISLAYNQAFENILIDSVRIIKPDGTQVAVETETLKNEVVFRGVPLFSDLRKIDITLKDVGPKDSVELKYTKKIEKAMLPGVYTMFFNHPLAVPIKASSLVINLPSGMHAAYKSTLQNKDPSITQKGSRTLYSWQSDNLDLERKFEVLTPPSFEIDPYVFFSTMESWEQLTAWYYPYFEDALSTINEKIRAKVLQIRSDANFNREIVIQSLYRFVSQNIAFYGISLNETGWVPYTPEHTMKFLVGDSKAKAGLLIAMLREAEIKAYPALIKTADFGSLLKGIPSLDFNHMIVAIAEDDGTYRFLDPSIMFAKHDYLPLIEQDRDVLVLDSKKPHWTKTPKLPAEENNFIKTKETLEIRDDQKIGSTASTIHKGNSAINLRYAISLTDPEEIEETMEDILKTDETSSDITNYDFENTTNTEEPFRIYLEMVISGKTEMEDETLSLIPPSVSDPFLRELTTPDERIHSIFLDQTQLRIWQGSLKIPEGFRVLSTPEDVDLQSPFGSFKREFRAVGNEIVLGNARFEINENTIPAASYSSFKEFIQKVAKLETQPVAFEKI